jgi:isopenicillin N synthase-like dioxygenase
MIPRIDAAPLFGPDTPARTAADTALMRAACDFGFLTLTAPIDTSAPRRAALLGVFALPEAEKRNLSRQRYLPENPNIYRGFAPFADASVVEAYDVGPDITATSPASASDPFLEPSPMPDPATLPLWRPTASAYFHDMEHLGRVLMRSFARGWGLDETYFDAAFTGGISTLRVIHAPDRHALLDDPAHSGRIIDHNGAPRLVLTGAHIDSGFVTLLAQDGTPGLQGEARDGNWHDVPCDDGAIAVNFGGLLERWTAGRIRATRHRVLSPGRDRTSIPFFYEPKVDATIAPLPFDPPSAFAPFAYGDHLWAAMMKFSTFKGMEHLRPPRGVRPAA